MKKQALSLVFCILMALGGGDTSPAFAQNQGLELQPSPNPQGRGAETQRTLFAVFLAYNGSINTALSISNILGAPPGIDEIFRDLFSSTVGTLEFYLWDQQGELISYETDSESPGFGLDPSGALEPGKTYVVLLSEILEAAGFGDQSFLGYGWVVANFEGVQGTANVTDFSTFNQATVMKPDLGFSFLERDAKAGLPLTLPFQ